MKFVNTRNGNVLTDFMKSAAILFYVNYTAVPVHSNNLCKHNGNNETQSLGCDFFEHRGENCIDVGTLLAFLFFFFRCRPMFSTYFVCVFLALVHLQVCVCAYGRIDIFLHVIFFLDAASSVV